MKKSLLSCIAIALISTPTAWAKLQVQARVEPVVGYDHSTHRVLFGGRLSAGLPQGSLEAEYTYSSDTQDSNERLKLGLLTTYPLGKFASLQARGGGQAHRSRHKNDDGTTTMTPVTYRPYLGLGAQATLTSKTYLTAGVTAIFAEWPDMKKNEYQTTFGFALQFP